MKRARQIVIITLGVALIPVIWLLLKVVGAASDRMLPSPVSVLTAAADIHPSIVIHFASTFARLLVGFGLGSLVGVSLGVLMNLGRMPTQLLLPSIQAIRAVPAAAAVPFFLLWFGFSETGRLLLVLVAVASNVAVATVDILSRTPERYAVMFRGFGLDGRRLVRSYVVPTVLGGILPTLRFSLAVVIGAQAISELLGAQVGLGYLIQNARATFALPSLFLAIILFGVMTAGADILLCFLWRRLVYWKREAVL